MVHACHSQCHSANVRHRVIRHGINYVTTDIVLFFKRRIRMRRNKNESERESEKKRKKKEKKKKEKKAPLCARLQLKYPRTCVILQDIRHCVSCHSTSLCTVVILCRVRVTPDAAHKPLMSLKRKEAFEFHVTIIIMLHLLLFFFKKEEDIYVHGSSLSVNLSL